MSHDSDFDGMGHDPSGVPGQPKTLKEWFFTLDHKVIGIWYLWGSIASFIVAGLAATAMRLELGSVGPTITEDASLYNLWLTMHGAVMILGFQIPALLGFLANWAVPIMVGGKDMAFPRVNAMSVWLLWAGILLALCNLVIDDPWNGMWTGYPPYGASEMAGNTALYSWIVIILGMSSVFGAFNLACTVVFMRAEGLGWYQMNMLTMTVFAANIIQLIFVPVLAASVLLLSLDKYLGFGFFNPEVGGDVLLYQNLFWFYSHPAVYVILLPFMGIMMDIFATFARNQIFQHKVAFWAILAFIPAGADVWVHHAYVAGLPNWLRLLMTFTTLLISIPFGLLLMSMIGTLWKGSVKYDSPMVWSMCAFFMLIIGGLTGIPNALTAIDYGISDSYVIMSHFHYVMAVSGGMAIFASVFYYMPKMSGRMANETMSKISAVGFFIGMNIVMGPLYFAGIEGMPRRYYDYQMFADNATIVGAQHWATIGIYVAFASIILMFVAMIHAVFAGKPAEQNPWQSESLEFAATATIPGQGNFPVPLRMHPDWSPYGYGTNPENSYAYEGTYEK